MIVLKVYILIMYLLIGYMIGSMLSSDYYSKYQKLYAANLLLIVCIIFWPILLIKLLIGLIK